jgi:hypothetical protein
MFFSRKDPIEQTRADVALAVRQAVSELLGTESKEELFGFALCTDDDLRTVYHVACTRSWVRERDGGYPGNGFIYVEWEDSASESLFQKISDRFSKLADERYPSDATWSDARDRRFEALVLALLDCRKDGLFAEDTLLCVGSTDPSEYLEALAMHAVERLNSPVIADQFAEHLGYEKHRKKA